MSQGLLWEAESSRSGAPTGGGLSGQGLMTRARPTSAAREEGTRGAALVLSIVLQAALAQQCPGQGSAVGSWSPTLLGHCWGRD